jgi:hypothetical protein
MKKNIILIVLMLSFLTTNVNAQKLNQPEWRHEIEVGYGQVNWQQTKMLFSQLIVIMGSWGGVSFGNNHWIGDFYASYGYSFNKTLTLRTTFSVDRINYGYFNRYLNLEQAHAVGSDTSGHFNVGKMSATTLGLDVDLEVNYINRKWVKFYGLVGVGADLLLIKYVPYNNAPFVEGQPNSQGGNYTYNNIYGNSTTAFIPFFNFQISPLCLKVGRQIGGFLELGYGYRGLISGGLYCKF